MAEETPLVPALQNAHLLDRLTPGLREGVEAGRYVIAGEGQRGKPVVVDAETGHFVPGTGRPVNANDPAYVGKTTGYRRSRAYNEAIEQLVPAWAGDSPDAVTSIEELLAAAKRLATPEKVKHVEQCPDCGAEVTFTVDAKPDQKMLSFLIERLTGQAQKTQQINIHSEEMIKMLQDTRVLHQIEVVSLTAEERASRIRAVSEA